MDAKKKKILFINRYFQVGGIQSSLINMANALCEKYDIEMLVFHPEGVLKDRLDPRIKVLKPSWALKAMGLSPKEALKTGNLLIFLFRVLGSLWARVFDNRLPIYIATKVQKKLVGYDLAVAFRAETRKNVITSGYARILDHCVDAKRKAVWLHYDASTLNSSRDFNRKYYTNIDKIVGVSESVMSAFEKVNPTLSDKMDYCYNFLNYDSIYQKSEAEQETKYPEGRFICFSACRLSHEKGINRALDAMMPVLKNHKDVMWYIAGDGPERENIESAIKENGLEEQIVLLGNQKNPYNYMKNADLYLSTSFQEAAPMVYLEAKALSVPVFTTRTLSSEEMLRDGAEDFICENSEEGIRAKFAELMDNREAVYDAKKHMSGYHGNNDDSMKKITSWLNEV